MAGCDSTTKTSTLRCEFAVGIASATSALSDRLAVTRACPHVGVRLVVGMTSRTVRSSGAQPRKRERAVHRVARACRHAHVGQVLAPAMEAGVPASALASGRCFVVALVVDWELLARRRWVERDLPVRLLPCPLMSRHGRKGGWVEPTVPFGAQSADPGIADVRPAGPVHLRFVPFGRRLIAHQPVLSELEG